MDSQKAKANQDAARERDVKRQLVKKFPQLTEKGIPHFNRFEIVRMTDEEFRFLVGTGLTFHVGRRTLNYINTRCKDLKIRKEQTENGLQVNPNIDIG